MANVINYIFNISGNFASNIGVMISQTEQLSKSVKEATGFIDKLGQKAMGFAAIADVVQNANEAFSTIYESGIALDSQMHDLSAVAGVAGDELKKIEGYARESAKAFGTDAAVAVEGYKLLLGQLTPELAKCPEALKSMGESVQITSKLMGNDGVAAAEVLTTAMNQYGVSLDDPMEASRKMAEMMNVMAAAGQEGSAELPQIKAALQQCGMAANAANVAFEETNAAIQVLDKAGKKGSEGGVALRNVLGTLSQGRFIPKDTREALQGAGVDINKLADTTQPLKSRLEVLKPLLNDAALFSKLFGTENANAARALVQGTDELGRLTEAVSGTNSAEEQAIHSFIIYNFKILAGKVAPIEKLGQPLLRESQELELKRPMEKLELESLNNITESKQDPYKIGNLQLIKNGFTQDNSTKNERENKREKTIYRDNLREEVESIIEELLV